MEDEEIEKTVFAYLKKKGFWQTERTLQNEQSRASSASQSEGGISRPEKGPQQHHDGYSKLRSWAYGSLDLYKHELLQVLYPVFIHCFMDLVAEGYMQEARTFFQTFREDHEMLHLRDLQKLEGILCPSHLEEMELARSLRQSKVVIKLCEYSCNLLLQYLQKTQSFSMLGVINEHINFEVSSGQPVSISDDSDVVALVGNNQDMAKQINQKEVRWGLLEDSIEERLEKTLSDSEKVEGENKEIDLDDIKKRSADGGRQGSSSKKLKKDKVVGTVGKCARSETSIISLAPRVKAELALPTMPTEVEQSILEDLRNRVQLSSLALPSVSFYTFINTHNGLNCASISHDGSLVAGGFSDSSLKIWNMSKLGQPAKAGSMQGENEYPHNETFIGHDEGKRSYTLFQGHSGPVYSSSFSPTGDFLLSSSSDSTIRLWSTKLNSNLVCYKGHNYPVWDVQFGPFGHYFVSASHDRTARIWSMDRIQPLRIMAGHLSDVDLASSFPKSMVMSLAMSPDGRYMASGDEDGMIMMWDLSTGRCEGTLLASGSADCTVKLWDVTSSNKASKMDENKGSSGSKLRLLKALPTKSTPVYTLRVRFFPEESFVCSWCSFKELLKNGAGRRFMLFKVGIAFVLLERAKFASQEAMERELLVPIMYT
ncbi:hypothetical protein HPP92_013964 [Vanilla planifolia]|uniref:TFIID subunit TAF5 NTD2 domain-containing protein n=1 Tax=Vanilla planifolia TaxID=51239 RepID=A0A835UUC1_VANPL|nr:hypothetical protein HPP92_013964 [Vanilla planifolia]